MTSKKQEFKEQPSPKAEEFLRTELSVNYTIRDFLDWDEISTSLDQYDPNLMREFQDLCVYDEQHHDQSIQLFEQKFHDLTTRYSLTDILKFILNLLTINTQINPRKNYLETLPNNFQIELGKSISLQTSKVSSIDISPEELLTLIKESNLLTHVFNIDTHLKSLLKGIKAGLYSNKRKNINGKKNEDFVQKILDLNHVPYKKQDASLIAGKKFDFSFSLNGEDYVLETNFFNNNGSKIHSETNRFINLDKDLQQSAYNFVYVTDGAGWKSSIPTLNKLLDAVEHAFNLNQFKEWIEAKVKEAKKK